MAALDLCDHILRVTSTNAQFEQIIENVFNLYLHQISIEHQEV